MAIAHNGNLSNAGKLRSALELSGAIFHTSSDTETIAYIVTKERLTAPSIEEALSRAMNTLEGADSLGFFPVQRLDTLCGGDHYCRSCFDGVYPTEIPRENDKNRFEQRLSEKQKKG